MGTILKPYRYRLVDNSSFEMPLPVSFSVMLKDSIIAEYNISDDEKITVHIVTKHKEEMLTPVRRPLTISDIYYLFSCRAFQDKTPFTMFELSLLGLKKYNVYDIIRKTRGITPFDAYWIKFSDETCSYDDALSDFNSITESYIPAPAPSSENIADIDEILNQHKVDVGSIPRTESEVDPESAPASSGGVMSQEDIEKLLAGASAEPEKKPDPESAPASSGGVMSQEDIEKLLAGASAEPEKKPEPESAPASSGGVMSQEDIEKLLNSMSEEAGK